MRQPPDSDRLLPADLGERGRRYELTRRRGLLAPARRFDEDLRRYEAIDAFVVWRREDTGATGVARSLWLLDRELRRAAAIVKDRKYHGLPAPITTREAGLSVRDARTGSIDLVLEPYGMLRDLLLSDPLQLAITAYALVGGVRRVSAWLRRPETTASAALPQPVTHEPVTVVIPEKLRVSAPIDADVHIVLADGGEVRIGSAVDNSR